MAKSVADTLQAFKQRNRTWREEADALLSMIDCLVLEKREAVYASSEFTTGRRFYKLCRQYNVRTKEDLKAKLGPKYASELLRPNEEEAIKFALRLREFGIRIIVTPNSLVVPGWSQPEYLDFWEAVIREKCSAIYFNEGWESSNGCAFEYLVGYKAGMSLYDHANKPIPSKEAKQMIGRACEQLEKEGFQTPELRRVYGALNLP